MSLTDATFTTQPSSILHIDLNSAFATAQQQADPYLRGKAIAVAAYNSPRGCIIAPSVEAKRHGVKVGMQVQQGQELLHDLIVLPPETELYRSVHLRLRELLSGYSDDVAAKSIDEFVVDFSDCPALIGDIFALAREIKQRIKREIGTALTVSVGIAPNRYLAKVAAGLNKPDGLDEINHRNVEHIFSRMELTGLTGIKEGNARRLQTQQIYTALDLLHASARTLKAAFRSIEGYYWYWRMRGREADDVEFGRKSYGNSYALPKPWATSAELLPILCKLIHKTGQRMRSGGYGCHGVHIGMQYRDGTYWHQAVTLKRTLLDSRDIYSVACKLMQQAPTRKPVAILGETAFSLQSANTVQGDIFTDVQRKQKLVKALDDINDKWGTFTIYPARMIGTDRYMPDRISFGGVKEIVEAVHR